MKIAVYNLEGKKVEDIELSDSVFGLKSNNDLVHQVYVTLAGNKRQVLAHAKDMAEVKGSGKKLWRQKGTGSARVGSLRNPLWRKGGVVFGPTKDRNFKKKINKKMAQKALMIALGEKVKAGQLVLVDEIKLKENKTKEFAKALTNLKLQGKILVGFDIKEKEFQRASRNIEKVSNTLTGTLNVMDILDNKHILMSKDSIKNIEEKYGKKFDRSENKKVAGEKKEKAKPKKTAVKKSEKSPKAKIKKSKE